MFVTKEVLGIGAGNSGPIPKVDLLLQNYPNPFNPTTIIGYTLPQQSRVTLSLYNMLGQCVATLVDGAQEAGYHAAVFNGTGLASGVYIYRLQAGKYVQSRMLDLVR